MNSPVEQSTAELGKTSGESRRSEFGWVMGRMLWVGNIGLLLVIVAWIAWDSKFPPTALAVRAALARLFLAGPASAVTTTQLGSRPILLSALCGAAIVTAIGVFVTLFAGAKEHRRLRAWFAFTLLLAAWLTVLVSWPELAWRGQQIRMRAAVGDFESLAFSLSSDWPTGDGKRPGLGSFMAYPQSRPRILMMLTSDTQIPVSAVERAENGALAFELVGDNRGSWLEWHPAGATPRTFTGGLEGDYELRRAAPLGRGWYLVRYR